MPIAFTQKSLSTVHNLPIINSQKGQVSANFLLHLHSYSNSIGIFDNTEKNIKFFTQDHI